MQNIDELIKNNPVKVLQGMIKAIEQKRLENYKFLTGSPVCSIQSGQIKRDENGKVVAAAKEYISDWLKLNKPDGVFNHPRLGEVQLSLGGIKDSLSHMSADVHVNAIPAIPYVLENSVLLEQSKDKDGKPIENFTIAAPILISGKKNYVVIRLKRSTLDKNEKPRFYIVAAELESEAQKNAALTLQDPRHDKSSLTGGKNRLLNILHDALAVNPDTENLQGFDSASDPLAITTDNAVDVLQGMIKTMLSVPARADTSLLDEADTEIEIVKLAYKKARQKFANQPFVQVEIISDKSIVLVGWQGIKHALSDKSNVVKALASTCVVDLIVKANFVKVLEDKHNGSKPDILQTLLYSSKMDVGEKAGQFDIGLVIREYRDGRKIYDFFTTNSGSENPASISGGNETVQPLAGHTYNINNQSLIVKGRTNTVKTAKGTKIDTVFAVVAADKVIASHTATGAANPNYPQELQPRDRSRDASVAWVQKTANNLDPDSLGRTGRADTGAPIVGSDLCVESGNGRTMAIQLAYARGNADEYHNWLLDEAEYFGFDRAAIEQFKQPVLVRIRTTPIDRVQFAIEANQDDKLSQSATERARSDAKLLDDHLLSLFNPNDNGDLMAANNYKFLSGFLSKLGSTESAQYADKQGNYTQSFITRIKQAVFAKAYNDDRLIDMMADQANPDLKNMLNSLTAAAPHFIKAQAVDKIGTERLAEGMTDSIEKSLNQDVLSAINRATYNILHAKSQNQDIAEYVSQQGLFEDTPDGVAELTVYIALNIRSPKKLSELFIEMAKYIEQQELHDKNLGLFGEPEPLGVLDVFLHAKNAIEQDYDLYDDISSVNIHMITSDNASRVLQNMVQVLSHQIIKDSAEHPVSLRQDQTDSDFLNGLMDGSIERSLEAIKRCDDIALSGTQYNLELEEIYKQYCDDLAKLPRNELFGEIHQLLPKLKHKSFVNKTSFNLLYAVYAFQHLAGQWHTTKKGRRISGFVLNVPTSKKALIDEIDPYTFDILPPPNLAVMVGESLRPITT